MSEPQGFFQRRPLRRALSNWLQRHQHPFNRGIHFVGIPLALAGVVLFCWRPWDEWYWGVLAFFGGYLLQWIGHLVEGNDLGEWAALKRVLGLPYVSISPRFHKEEGEKGRRGEGETGRQGEGETGSTGAAESAFDRQ